jgi:hypothetical protein
MSAPRIPNKESYWQRKGKSPLLVNGKETYKNVTIFTHDDWDGIQSAITMKEYLINKGFNIIGYGIVNYQEGWKYTKIDTNYINIAVDFATNHEDIDVFIDHHGSNFGTDNKKYAIKTATNSAVEGVHLQCGIPQEKHLLEPIDMIDAARYNHYGVSFSDLIHFDFDKISEMIKADKEISKSNRLNNNLNYRLFAKQTLFGMVNQYLKRADHNTLIEVIHNCSSSSPYQILSKLREFYSGNNLNKLKERGDFLKDGAIRLNEMSERTRGKFNTDKTVYDSQADFLNDFFISNKINLNSRGYQIIGNLCYVPSNTWCNAIRIKSILEEDIKNGVIQKNSIDYILLKYGNTLQMVAFDNDIKTKPIYKKMNQETLKNEKIIQDFETSLKIEKLDLTNDEHQKQYENITKNLQIVEQDGILIKYILNFGEYMTYLLNNITLHLGYKDPSTYISNGEDGGLVTVSGGHFSIGSISNVVGSIKEGSYKDLKYIDFLLNKIINDISTCEWNNLKTHWSEIAEYNKKEPDMNFRILMIDDIRTNGNQKTQKEI